MGRVHKAGAGKEAIQEAGIDLLQVRLKAAVPVNAAVAVAEVAGPITAAAKPIADAVLAVEIKAVPVLAAERELPSARAGKAIPDAGNPSMTAIAVEQAAAASDAEEAAASPKAVIPF